MNNEVYVFADKWLNKFSDPKINYRELVDHYLADDCQGLGFIMDSGKSFSAKYGEASYDSVALAQVINQIEDYNFLGTAIYSQWRYFNHWADDAQEILANKNRDWFIIAFKHLKQLTSDETTIYQGQPREMSITLAEKEYPDDSVLGGLKGRQKIIVNDEYRYISFEIVSSDQQRAMIVKLMFARSISFRYVFKVAEYFSKPQKLALKEDTGEVKIINDNGESFKYSFAYDNEILIDHLKLENIFRYILETMKFSLLKQENAMSLDFPSTKLNKQQGIIKEVVVFKNSRKEFKYIQVSEAEESNVQQYKFREDVQVIIKKLLDSKGVMRALESLVDHIVQEERKTYDLYSVVFPNSHKRYYYLANEDFKIEDQVVVTIGDNNQEKVVEIVDKRTYDEYTIPYEVKKLKYILRKWIEKEDN